ncbi:MAG: terminase large subunit [Mycetocola sp.]
MILLTRSRTVALLGEQAPPRINVAPPPTRANSWEDVADLSRSFGIELDQWQEAVLQSAMGERSDGSWSAKRVGLSAPRQNGKSQLIVARALAGALLFGEKKIVISAHAQDTARETFAKFIEQIDNCPALAERVDKVMNAINRESIKFQNGAVVQFKARTVSGSRGFSSDCLLLDEAQILGMPAWVSINSTMSARPNPQVWLLGTPPTPEDNGEVFTSVRESALAGTSKTLAWLEWAADPKADPALDSTRASANPAWDTRINHEVVQGEFETYPPARFSLDRLGIWRSELEQRVIPMDVWATRAIPAAEVPTAPPAAFGLDMSHDRVVSIGVCVGEHVEVAALDKVADTLGAVEWLIERAGKTTVVVVDGQSPAASMVPALRAAGVQVVVTSAPDMAKACGSFYDAVLEERLTHFDQQPLNAALSGARKRPIGTAGGWGWDRKDYSINLAPLVSVTLAMFGASTAAKPKSSAAYAF